MFLKKDTLTYGECSVTLYELSGLQRIEYLEYIQQRTAHYDEAIAAGDDVVNRVAFVQLGVDINAWLVSRSLWNGDQTQDQAKLCDTVVSSWSYEALGSGADIVLSLSGMAVSPAGGDDVTEATSPEKP